MVHGSTRIGCVYLAGVLAGSMGTSIIDPDVYLVGASGGVYALLAAHLANVMLNYNNMQYGIVRIVGIFLFGKFFLDFSFILFLYQSLGDCDFHKKNRMWLKIHKSLILLGYFANSNLCIFTLKDTIDAVFWIYYGISI